MIVVKHVTSNRSDVAIQATIADVIFFDDTTIIPQDTCKVWPLNVKYKMIQISFTHWM